MSKQQITPEAKRVAIIGSGSWGTTFAKILADGGNYVTMWARRDELVDEINTTHRNSDYLRGIKLPGTITATSNLAAAVKGASQVYLSVPSQALREKIAGELERKLRAQLTADRLAQLVQREDGRLGGKVHLARPAQRAVLGHCREVLQLFDPHCRSCSRPPAGGGGRQNLLPGCRGSRIVFTKVY